MNTAYIREQIRVVLCGVPGIGVVHDYERFSNDWNKFLALFSDPSTGTINGAMFARRQHATQQRMHGETETADVFAIRRYRALNDSEASGVAFDNHLDDLLAALRRPALLNAGGLYTSPDWGPMAGSVGAQLDVSEPRMFGSVLCHYAELRLCVARDIITD